MRKKKDGKRITKWHSKKTVELAGEHRVNKKVEHQNILKHSPQFPPQFLLADKKSARVSRQY